MAYCANRNRPANRKSTQGKLRFRSQDAAIHRMAKTAAAIAKIAAIATRNFGLRAGVRLDLASSPADAAGSASMGCVNR